jgi:hypothetical protein
MEKSGRDGAGPLLAKGKNKKRKKRKKSGGGGAVAPVGPELHAKQEGATDEPYKWQVSLLSDFSLTTGKQGEAKTGSADYDLLGRAGYIISKSIVIGGELDYSETSFKVDGETNTASAWVLSAIGAYNFGNLDEDEMVFFIFGDFGIGQGSSKAGDDTVKTSKSKFGFGAGLHYFMDTNVALTTEFSYELGTDKVTSPSGADPNKYSTLHLARIGFSLFL